MAEALLSQRRYIPSFHLPELLVARPTTRRKSARAAGLAALTLVTTVACGGGSTNTPPESSTAAGTSQGAESSTSATETSAVVFEEERAAALHGDGKTVKITFTDRNGGYPDVVVYTDPFENGEGSGAGSFNSGEPFFADCSVEGRGIPTMKGEEGYPFSSPVFYLGNTKNGDRRFAPNTYMVVSPEGAKQIEPCEAG
jgi:hypothetical protein